jgi:hypothetical protein
MPIVFPGMIEKNMSIYTTIREEHEYLICPWLSIISQTTADIEIVKMKDSRVEDNGDISIIEKKFSIPQPVKVAFCGKDEDQVAGWIKTFLQRIGYSVVLDNTVVTIFPLKIDYEDKGGYLPDSYQGVITMNFEYGIYSDIPVQRIPQIL